MSKVACILFLGILIFFISVFPAWATMADIAASEPPPAGAVTAASAPSAAVSDQTNSTAAPNYGITPVEPKAFVGRLNRLIAMIGSSIDSIAVPLASTMLAICALIFIVGLFTGIHFVRRVGLWGTVMVALGLLLIYGRPLFLGIIQAIASFMSV